MLGPPPSYRVGRKKSFFFKKKFNKKWKRGLAARSVAQSATSCHRTARRCSECGVVYKCVQAVIEHQLRKGHLGGHYRPTTYFGSDGSDVDDWFDDEGAEMLGDGDHSMVRSDYDQGFDLGEEESIGTASPPKAWPQSRTRFLISTPARPRMRLRRPLNQYLSLPPSARRRWPKSIGYSLARRRSVAAPSTRVVLLPWGSVWASTRHHHVSGIGSSASRAAPDAFDAIDSLSSTSTATGRRGTQTSIFLAKFTPIIAPRRFSPHPHRRRFLNELSPLSS